MRISQPGDGATGITIPVRAIEFRNGSVPDEGVEKPRERPARADLEDRESWASFGAGVASAHSGSAPVRTEPGSTKHP